MSPGSSSNQDRSGLVSPEREGEVFCFLGQSRMKEETLESIIRMDFVVLACASHMHMGQ
jgi:hypothetical protein